MKKIIELRRIASPDKLPQSLAWDGSHFWIGSLASKIVYQIEPNNWKVIWTTNAPGLPFGMVSIGNELRVLCGESQEDSRHIRQCIPAHGFDSKFDIPCPDDTGSQLSYDGKTLHVSQWYNKKVHAIDESGNIQKSYDSPRGICGQTFANGILYLATTEAEETNEYYLTRIDIATGKAEDIAEIPFQARSLAFDGTNFWTNHRAAHETVCFKI